MVFAGFQSSLIARAMPGMMEKGTLKNVSVHRRVTWNILLHFILSGLSGLNDYSNLVDIESTALGSCLLSRTRSRSLDILSFACLFAMHVLPRLIMTRDTGTSLYCQNSLKRSHLSISMFLWTNRDFNYRQRACAF